MTSGREDGPEGCGVDDRMVAAVTIPPAEPAPAPAPQTRPGPIRRDWATIVCFSCCNAGHGVGRCLKLNKTFPFMLQGRIGREGSHGTSPGVKRRLIRGGGHPPFSTRKAK